MSTTPRGVLVSERLIRIGMVGVAIVTLVLAGVYLARDFTKVATMVRMGDIWSMLALSERPAARFAEVDLNDFPRAPRPSEGDTLLTIDGVLATRDNYFTIFNTTTPVGSRHTITFTHDGAIDTTDVVTRPIPVLLKVQVIALHGLTVVFTLGLFGIGLWAYMRKADAPPVRVMTLFCFTMALASLMTRVGIAGAYASFQLPQAMFTLIAILGAPSVALWVHLQMVFPRSTPWCARHRGRGLLLIYGPWVLMLFLPLAPPEVRPPIAQAVTTIYWVIGFILLGRHHLHAETLLERRQTRLVLWGSAPAVLLQLATGWAGVLVGAWFTGLSYVTKLYILNANSLLLLLIPVSVGYAFGRYRLLEVEARLKRGTRFLLVTGAAVLVLLALCGLIYIGSARVFPLLGIHSDVPTIAVAVALAFSFLPAQHSLRRSLENHIYPERLRLRATLQEFLQQSHASRVFWTELAQRLRDGIGASAVFPLLRRREALTFAVECCELAPFKAGDQFGQALLSAKHPLLVDEIIASGRVPLTPPQRDWLAERGAALIVPLETVSGLRGFLVVSERLSGDDYTPEELEILRSLSPQIALIAETIELLEERTEKQRLEDEVRMARSVQEGLLPHQLPPTPGLEAAARIRFCGDVAGDYYDVIALEGGRTLLAAGDVTGKGMASALIMSNLQAALRAINGVGLSLAEVVARINTLIHENTPAELFITLFVGVYDPATATLSYVNAGHDPPIVCGHDGTVTRLTATGLLVGVIPGATYEERRMHLNPGDLVIVYTDGATEAMNDAEEEFGDARLAAVAASNRDVPLPSMLATIEEGVTAFHGGTLLRDDMTLLAVRRIGADGREPPQS